MSDKLDMSATVDVRPESSQIPQGTDAPGSSGQCSSSHHVEESSCVIDVERVREHGNSEEEPLLETLECRICQEEDSLNNLESPCGCSGSLKFAHRKCVQRWCNEKGDITCEICHQLYQPDYTAPMPPPVEEFTIDIGDGWTIAGTPFDLNDPRILAMAAAERHFMESDYEEYADSSANGAAFCRSAALILMALLLFRHAMSLTNTDGDEDASTFFSLFMLRAAGFLLPCYIMAWAVTILQRRRQQQEAASLAATEVAIMLEAGRRRGLQFAFASGPAIPPQQTSTLQQEPVE